MSLYGVMRTGVSGMSAQSNKLSTVSKHRERQHHRLQAGFDRFSSLILKSGSGNYDSAPSRPRSATPSPTPAISSSRRRRRILPFRVTASCVVQDQSGNNFLTRAGSFVPTVRATWSTRRLPAHGLQHPERRAPAVAANGFSGLQVINVNQLGLQAEPSTTATVAANLDPSAAVILPAALPPVPRHIRRRLRSWLTTISAGP